jgi:Kef-type K+ transport system membrane component KefB
MSPFLQLAIALAIIITLAKLGGYLSYLLGQPSVLGELVVGIILGPSLINLVHLPFFTDQHLGETIQHLAEVGVLLLMFLAGLDLHINDLLNSGKVAGLSGVLGMLLPLGLGTLTGMLFSMGPSQAVFTGLILSATSVSISAQTLMELNVLRSRVGVSLLGAAVFDDILVLLVLSIFTAIAQPGSEVGLISVLWIILRILLFLSIASLVGLYFFPRLSTLVSSLPISQGLIALAFVVILLYGWAAESLGQMAAITGAFLAGIWLGRTPAKDHIHAGIATIAYGFFVPIFFVNIGLSANARELNWGSVWLLLVMLLVAVVGKVVGAGYGAYLGKLTRREALQLGVGMMSRGEVGLIVAAVGIELGLIDQMIFSSMVVIVILTTIMTPPLLRLLFRQKKEAEAPTQESSKGAGS